MTTRDEEAWPYSALAPERRTTMMQAAGEATALEHLGGGRCPKCGIDAVAALLYHPANGDDTYDRREFVLRTCKQCGYRTKCWPYDAKQATADDPGVPAKSCHDCGERPVEEQDFCGHCARRHEQIQIVIRRRALGAACGVIEDALADGGDPTLDNITELLDGINTLLPLIGAINARVLKQAWTPSTD